jgi:adenylate cyclase
MSEEVPSRDTVYMFESYRLDHRAGLCRINDSGRWEPIVLGSRALGVLRALVQQRGELVTKQALMDAVWPGLAIEDSNLTVQISAVRRALDESRVGGSCIQTVIGRGYRFLPVVRSAAASASSPDTNQVLARPRVRPNPRLSLVVVPSRNPGGDHSAGNLADVIADDLATSLSHLPDAFVTAASTAGILEAESMDVRRVGVEFDVRYVVQVSVRNTVDQTGVNVRLIDVETGGHLWADRVAIDSDDTTAARGEVIGRLTRTLSLKLLEEANQRIEALPSREWTLSDLVIHGRALFNRPPSVVNRDEAIDSFEQAFARDPDFLQARFWIASVLVANVADGWSRSIKEDEARAERLIFDVFRVDGNVPEAHACLGILRRLQGRLSDSKIALEIATSLAPNYSLAFGQLGQTFINLGQPEAAIPHLEKSLRLAPHTPDTPIFYHALGTCHLLRGEIDDAIVCLRKARVGNSQLYYVHLTLASALGLKGELDEAKDALRIAIDIMPEIGSLSGVRELLSRQFSPEALVLYEKTFFTGLQRAGIPNVDQD